MRKETKIALAAVVGVIGIIGLTFCITNYVAKNQLTTEISRPAITNQPATTVVDKHQSKTNSSRPEIVINSVVTGNGCYNIANNGDNNSFSPAKEVTTVVSPAPTNSASTNTVPPIKKQHKKKVPAVTVNVLRTNTVTIITTNTITAVTTNVITTSVTNVVTTIITNVVFNTNTISTVVAGINNTLNDVLTNADLHLKQSEKIVPKFDGTNSIGTFKVTIPSDGDVLCENIGHYQIVNVKIAGNSCKLVATGNRNNILPITVPSEQLFWRFVNFSSKNVLVEFECSTSK